MSQAYLFHKIWQTKTINKYNFKDLLKNWTLNFILERKIKNNLKKKGIFPIIEVENLKEKNLKKLLQKFDRYNISSQIWYTIIPKEWKNKVTHRWINKRKKNFKISEKQIKISVLSKKKKFSYKLVTSPLLEQNKKLNKQYQSNYLCYSYLDFEKIPNFLKLGKNKETVFNKEILQTSKNKINIDIKSNLVLWLIPPFPEKKDVTKIEKIDISKISLLKKKNKKTIQNKKLLRERERHQTIRQWKWKSKNVEKKFKELGDMASLMTFMQDEENVISLSVKMRENLNLFRLLFCRDVGINKLTINSEHRIPRVLDDEILMYKVVSVFSKSKVRFKKVLNFKNLDESTSRIDFFQNNIKTSFKLINLEDIMLSRHCKELKVLSLLYLNKNKTSNLDKYFVKKNEEKLMKLQKIGDENKSLTIKHFLWPSFRLEDLACINRFWFNTNNGSRFTMLRIRMYT